MLQDMQNSCNSCHEYLTNKFKPKTIKSKLIPKSNLASGEMIMTDSTGKLSRSQDGKFFFLTITDHFSRHLEAIPLPNIASHSIIKTLNDYFSRNETPKIMLSDNASNFCSQDFKIF